MGPSPRRAVRWAREEAGALSGDGRALALAAVAGGWLFVLGTRVVVPAVLPQVRSAFDLSSATAGLVVTALWSAYAVTQFPGGLLADRVGEKRTLVASAATTALGALALFVSPTFGVFVGGVVLFGLSSGLYAPPRVTVLSRIYPDRDGTALGITFAVGNVGAALLPVVAGGLAVTYGWRAGFGFVVVPLVCVVVALWAFVPGGSAGETGDDVRPRETAGRIARALGSRPVPRAWVAMTLALFAYQGLTAFLPTYLVAEKGLDTVTASALFGLLFAAGAVAQACAGSAADRYGERRVLAAIGGASAVLLASFPFVEGVVPLAVLTALTGLRPGLGPVGNGYVASVLPEEVQGGGYGLFRTLYLAVGSLGSTFVGALAGIGHFDAAFLALGAITGVATVGYATFPDPERVEVDLHGREGAVGRSTGGDPECVDGGDDD